MKSRTIFFILIFAIIFSINLVSATSIDDNTTIVLEDSFAEFDLSSVDENNIDGELSESSVNDFSLENSDVIWVKGSNPENGNGSEDNPYKSFDLACDNINDKNNVTIKVYDGTYELGSILKFNCTNLHIQGIGDNVIIKNKYNVKGTAKVDGSKQAFGLTSLNGTFLMSNILVDASGWTQTNNVGLSNSKLRTYFHIFYNELGDNEVIFKNCTFKQYWRMLPITIYNGNVLHNNKFSFIQCNFEYEKNLQRYAVFFGPCLNVTFRYCSFNLDSVSLDEKSENYTFNSCWFGQNTLPNYFYYQDQAQSNYGEYIGMQIDKYAEFHITEEKIDDNTYDIIGKLMWNDSTTDGIENLPPMTVTLTSETGEIPATATLENGMFKVRYTTNANEHNITAKLDSEELKLAFNYNVDITAEAKPINYGDDQNITINLPYNASGIIKLTFEDETSEEIQITKVSSLNYTIKKALKAGTNKINVSLIDEDNHSYGSNVIDYTISKISDYTLDIDAPTNVTVGDTVEITVTLPEGAKGNVTAFVGKNNFTKEITENIVKINVNGFVAGENEVTINYTGDDKYSEKTIHQFITAKKVETPVNNNTLVEDTQSDSNKPTFTINLPSDATGNLTVTINGKNYTKELVNGSATIVVDDLPAGEYNAIITYSGDDKYNPIIKNTTTIVKEVVKPSDSKTDNNKVTKKAATKITAKKKTFKAKKKIKKYTITLKSGKKPVKKVWVTLKIKGKKLLKAKTNAKGKATFKIKKLTKKGKYNAVIKFKGNKNYKATSKKVKITIKK